MATQPFVLLLYNRRISSFGRALFKSSKKLLSSPPTNPTLSLAQHFQSLAILYCHANWQCSMTPICSYLRVYCNRKIGRKKELKSYNVIWRQQWPRSVRTQQEWLIQGHLTHIHRTDTKIARWDRVSREGKGTRAQEFGGSKHATILITIYAGYRKERRRKEKKIFSDDRTVHYCKIVSSSYTSIPH